MSGYQAPQMKNSSTIIRNSLKRLGEGMGGADDSIPRMTKRAVLLASAATILSAVWLVAQQQTAPPSIHDGFRLVEVASVSDAMEQLYGQKAYMSHEMRPLAPAKFAGPAVTVMLKELDDTEHRMIPFIEKFRSIREAVK